MTQLPPLQPYRATAEQVVVHLASHILGPGWRMTFGRFDTSQGSDRHSMDRHDEPAWRICWGGLFEEAQTGDLRHLLDRLLAHSEKVEAVGRTVVEAENVPAWLNGVNDELAQSGDVSLVVCSKVTSGENSVVKHIPMMDFRCEPSERSCSLVVSSMQRLGQKRGVVLETGRSYHYYGFDLLDVDEWQEFMHRSLLLTPFVDARYIGHRLLAGTARLRITGSRGKRTAPRVVAYLCADTLPGN